MPFRCSERPENAGFSSVCRGFALFAPCYFGSRPVNTMPIRLRGLDVSGGGGTLRVAHDALWQFGHFRWRLKRATVGDQHPGIGQFPALYGGYGEACRNDADLCGESMFFLRAETRANLILFGRCIGHHCPQDPALAGFSQPDSSLAVATPFLETDRWFNSGFSQPDSSLAVATSINAVVNTITGWFQPT